MFNDRVAQGRLDADTEAEIRYLLVLKYAADGRYDLSQVLLDDLLRDCESSAAANEALGVRDWIHTISRSRRNPFLLGDLYDRSGRTDILIFAGYYGIWIGIATPVFFEASSAQAYALGLLLGAPASLAIAKGLTDQADISKGRASMISLGGNLGTWQGSDGRLRPIGMVTTRSVPVW